MFGVHADMHDDFRRWSDAFIESGDADADPAAAMDRAQAMAAFRAYFADELAVRAGSINGDVHERVAQSSTTGFLGTAMHPPPAAGRDTWLHTHTHNHHRDHRELGGRAITRINNLGGPYSEGRCSAFRADRVRMA